MKVLLPVWVPCERIYWGLYSDMAAVHRCLLVSDFNAAPLAGYLRNDKESPQLEVVEAPYGLVEPVLLGEHEIWQQQPNCALVWTRPQVVSAFARLLDGEVVTGEEIDAEVELLVELFTGAAGHLTTLFVALWTLPPYERGLGVGDLKSGGVMRTLLRMNTQLIERADRVDNLYLFDAARWLAAADGRRFDAKLWHMGKIAFANSVLRVAVGETKAALRALDGRAKKLIVLDLDDTLWGGIVGEVGWRELQMGGHDHIGEAHADFQRALKALARRGVLLALASRNEEAVALEAIDEHPEMILRRGDFAAWRIHWGDKAESVEALVSELNIGLQDVVFIDDSPAERARVREALPEVLVPEWPADPAFYVEALSALKVFDIVSLSREDRERTQLYAIEERRRQARGQFSSMDAWLERLELQVFVEELNEENGARAVQLLNKTNQMNLCTRRLSRAELEQWSKGRGCEFWTFRVVDRFGDAGLAGLLGLQSNTSGVTLCDFVLSCRVMGRQIEETMLHFALRRARVLGGDKLVAEFLPTAKNKPCYDFFARTPLERDGHLFYGAGNELVALPSHVQFHS
jgi:FkbH-like protein